MKLLRKLLSSLTVVALCALFAPESSGADLAPTIAGLSVPQGGSMQILFRAQSEGPFRVQARASLDPSAEYADVVTAVVTKVEPGIFLAMIPRRTEDEIGFFRIVSDTETITELKGWGVRLTVSQPANGNYFVPGERPVVTVTILDTVAQGITPAALSTLGLYMYGPQDPSKTVTASKLLNAITDRAVQPHHYIDLRTNPDVQVNGTALNYTLQPVTDEAAGTYTISLRAVLGSDAVQQIMKFAKVQIGTSDVESPVFTNDKCAACHLGASSGKMYLHHVDPGRSPIGSFSLDMEPQDSCKSCHNNDGYAAYRLGNERIPDPIMFRAHGVHNGAELKSDANINSTSGLFRDYTHVEFPADVRNCTACHVDDRWQTVQSRMACGSCHDTIWFGPKADAPAGMTAHVGGPASNDTGCALCHGPEGVIESVAEAHAIPVPALNEIDVTMTPPANGKFYVAGEKPVVTLVFKDDTGKAIDQTLVNDANFSSANLYVYGPRSRPVPVLTTAAMLGISAKNASVSNRKDGPWPINGKIFKVAINGSAPREITITGASDLVTPEEVVASLNPVIGDLNGGATASVSGSRVNIRTKVTGDAARIEIYKGEVSSAMVWENGNVILDPDVTVPSLSSVPNDVRERASASSNDPRVSRTAAGITYQLDDVAGLAPGTYNVYTYSLPKAGKVPQLDATCLLGHTMFQVGTATPQKKIATNCSDCHGDNLMHFYEAHVHPAPFDTDYCTACHDYGRPGTGDLFKNQGGTSLNGWSGYGAMPIAARVHGVHRGAYLEYPERVYANATKDTFGHIIFPQDIRNCTKCHAESDTWKQKPSRLACMACHDSDVAQSHAKLMTFPLDPLDPYGTSAIETCVVCHGEGAELSADKVHSLSNPYVPPYPREAE